MTESKALCVENVTTRRSSETMLARCSENRHLHLTETQMKVEERVLEIFVSCRTLSIVQVVSVGFLRTTGRLPETITRNKILSEFPLL